MSRSSPYMNKPPENWSTLVSSMRSTEMFLMSTVGPTVFVVKTSTSESLYKVYIGQNQRCSCGGGEGRGRLCEHLMYVMIKVLRVPEENPLSWQLSLVDTEVTNILAGNLGGRDNRRTHAFLRRGSGERRLGSSEGERKVDKDGNSEPQRERQELVEDEVCPICQDDMTQEELEQNLLCFCKATCGSNFHTKCLRMYATHAKSEKKKVLCPMCRGEWGEIPEEANKKVKKSTRYTPNMPTVKCKSCKITCRGIFFRCAQCTNPSFDFCGRCFRAPSNHFHHDMRHVFVQAESQTYPTVWTAAVPPIDRSNTFSLLQSRELSDNDYQLLLSLDGDNVPPLHRHLVQALEKVEFTAVGSEDKCTICMNLLSIDTALRRLPCAGRCVVHESCALSTFIEAQSEGGGSATVTCQSCGDGEALFPSLKRCPRRRKPETPVAAEEVLTTNQASGDSVSGGFVLTGNVFGGISGAAVGVGVNANVGGGGSGRPPLQQTQGQRQRHQVRRRPTGRMQPVGSSDDLSQGLITSQNFNTTRRSDSAPSSLTASASAETLNSMNSMRSSMSGVMSRSARRHKSPVTLTRARQQQGGGQSLPPSGFDITSTSYASGSGGSGATAEQNLSRTGRGRIQRGFGGSSARSRMNNNSNSSSNSGSIDFSLGGAKLDTSGAGRSRVVRREGESGGGGRSDDENNAVVVSDRELILTIPSLRLATS
ncbi:hypothetical protein TrST_g1459 [Triparma strigata]|uniref:Uncharacterized protein n=1 Tax=Triparma strigata TaxID=1606541 RepID=A0A9W6ZKH4_9STRA|nr:hypothetical protein TrST_g1459 [Triparma strigata]